MKKLKGILAIIISAALMLTAMSMVSFADQYDSAAKITSGKTVSGEISRDSTILYKLTASEKGTLNLEWSTGIKWLEIRVIDEDGASIKVDSMDMKVGTLFSGGAESDYIDTEWDKHSEKTKASASFSVNKGTYYVKLWAPRMYSLSSNSEEGSYKLTATYPSSSATDKTFSYLGITLKKGSTLQLEAVDADAKDTKWTSSKKKVAAVSSTGKITAKKKGTTIITCKSGDVTVTLKVTVK